MAPISARFWRTDLDCQDRRAKTVAERGDIIRFGLDRLVRGGVRGVWVRGSLPRGPVVWAGNHHSWWDGFAAASVLRAAERAPSLLMDGDNLGDYGFLRRAGVIPATEPRAALDALRQNRVLIVFPEGELRPAGPLGPLLPGAEWLARRAPATLVAVALRVVSRGHQWSEVYIDLDVVPADGSLSGAMSAGLARLDADLLAGDPREPLPGFLLTVPGKSSWDERITRWSSVLRR
jgi:hypothetical protein